MLALMLLMGETKVDAKKKTFFFSLFARRIGWHPQSCCVINSENFVRFTISCFEPIFLLAPYEIWESYGFATEKIVFFCKFTRFSS
jgi:hypothetical protein